MGRNRHAAAARPSAVRYLMTPVNDDRAVFLRSAGAGISGVQPLSRG